MYGCVCIISSAEIDREEDPRRLHGKVLPRRQMASWLGWGRIHQLELLGRMNHERLRLDDQGDDLLLDQLHPRRRSELDEHERRLLIRYVAAATTTTTMGRTAAAEGHVDIAEQS